MNDVLDKLDIPHDTDVPLGPLTWYGVGGTAACLARPRTVEQLAALAAHCHKTQAPLRVLGSGANLLVRNTTVPGVVVRLDAPGFAQLDMDTDTGRITAGGGYDLFKLVTTTAKAGLAGLETVAGIPASVGGAVRMNAGGAYGEIGSAVHSVKLMAGDGEVYERNRDDLVFSYRKTNIMAPLILAATFQLTPDDADQVMKRVKEIFIYKKNSQPMGDRSAGCSFKNPPAAAFAEGTEKMPAGMLIDKAGLKGYRHGAAEVSSVHANFITADRGSDNAAADDIAAVIEHVETRVEAAFGVRLEREVVIWP